MLDRHERSGALSGIPGSLGRGLQVVGSSLRLPSGFNMRARVKADLKRGFLEAVCWGVYGLGSTGAFEEWDRVLVLMEVRNNVAAKSKKSLGFWVECQKKLRG